MQPVVVYFSTKSGNTARYVNKLGFQSIRMTVQNMPIMDFPYVLVTPTYGGGDDRKAVPPPVIKMLNIKENRDHLIGVVSTGNRNFGSSFGAAGKVISQKCEVPHLHSVELFGTIDDVEEVQNKLLDLFKTEGEIDE